MAPCKPAKSIKVRVPRQNAQRLGPSLNATVRSVGKKEGFIVQILPPVQEQPGAAGASSSAENASEWNSLLINARATRGPYWDVSTQQFLVEKDSKLYYDPTELLEAARSVLPPPPPSLHSQTQAQIHLQHHHQQQQHQSGSISISGSGSGSGSISSVSGISRSGPGQVMGSVPGSGASASAVMASMTPQRAQPQRGPITPYTPQQQYGQYSPHHHHHPNSIPPNAVGMTGAGPGVGVGGVGGMPVHGTQTRSNSMSGGYPGTPGGSPGGPFYGHAPSGGPGGPVGDGSMVPGAMGGMPGMSGMGGMGGMNVGGMSSPVRPGMMDGGSATPEMYARRMTRGMSDGFQGYPG